MPTYFGKKTTFRHSSPPILATPPHPQQTELPERRRRKPVGPDPRLDVHVPVAARARHDDDAAADEEEAPAVDRAVPLLRLHDQERVPERPRGLAALLQAMELHMLSGQEADEIGEQTLKVLSFICLKHGIVIESKTG